jgi:hypothetical protein
VAAENVLLLASVVLGRWDLSGNIALVHGVFWVVYSVKLVNSRMSATQRAMLVLRLRRIGLMLWQ